MNQIPLKVLFVCSGNHPGFGIAPFVKSQADALEKEGVQVDFFRITRKGLTGYLSHISPLQQVIREGNHDIIHAHYTFCGWIARLACSSCRLVVSYMGSDTYGSVNARGNRRIKSLPVVLQGMLLNYFADAIIVKSENLRRMVLRKRVATVMPNGVDFEVFYPFERNRAIQKLHLDAGKRYALFLGNPADPRKNYSLASEASKIARQTIDFQLLAPYPVKPEEVPLYLNAADLLLVTSFLEGSPNVVKEAMACNCPVVATPSGDIAGMIAQTEQCQLAAFSPSDVAEKIVQVLKTGKRSDGRARIPHLDNRVVARNLLQLYHQLLHK